MKENSLKKLREELKAQIKIAIKAPIGELIEKLGPVPLNKKLNTASRKLSTDKLLIDLGETKSSGCIQTELIPIELAGNNHGRDLITNMIIHEAKKTDELLMIEIGSFLGGSALRWAKASPTCRVISIDPWANDHTEYLSDVYNDPQKKSMLNNITEKDFKATINYLQKSGSLSYTKQIIQNQANIDLVRSQSPAFLLSLYFRQIYPDIIYFDADKEGQDIDLAMSVFPDSIICGDDYIWIDNNKVNPIMTWLKVMETNDKKIIYNNGQSWILSHEKNHDLDCARHLSTQNNADIEMPEDAKKYWGNCSICGVFGAFEKLNWRERESFRCTSCRGSLREREQAKTILVHVLNSEHSNLKDLVSSGEMNQLAVYEPGVMGAMRKYTKNLNKYIQSSLQDSSDSNVQVEDLHALNIESNTIDLMISSDIMEHVDDPHQAFTEILRVLKPGGCHCFTVPLHSMNTSSRVKINNSKKIYLKPKHYHGDGKGGQSLVITDFGCDIINILNDIGYSAEIVWCQEQGIEEHVCGTVVAKKMIT